MTQRTAGMPRWADSGVGGLRWWRNHAKRFPTKNSIFAGQGALLAASLATTTRYLVRQIVRLPDTGRKGHRLPAPRRALWRPDSLGKVPVSDISIIGVVQVVAAGGG